MKKITVIACLLSLSFASAQFKIEIEALPNFTPKEVYLYSLSGSKDILNTKENRKGNNWQIKVSKPYTGMMKLYFPENGTAINFISENKDVKLKFNAENGKISTIQYLDESNALMNNLQDVQQKKEYILPALYQMKEYYKDNSSFSNALNAEITRLSQSFNDVSKYPFINYYQTNYQTFLEKSADKKPVTRSQILDFLNKSNDMLETSSLLRPILVSYLNAGDNANLNKDVDELIKVVNVETPRGQTVLSELIEIFDAYEMTDLKNRYLTEAKNLKCTINERLSGTIQSQLNTEIGATFSDYDFKNATNTKSKSISNVNADKKVIVFWSSTCSHCEAELPVLLGKYNAMKAQKTEIIALSLDSDKNSYQNKIKDLPWINDSELNGWHSSYAEKYNVHATPTYFVLDRNNKIIAKPDHAKDVISFLKLQ